MIPLALTSTKVVDPKIGGGKRWQALQPPDLFQRRRRRDSLHLCW